MSAILPAPGPVLPPPRRLVVRGVNWLGDAIMTLPALDRLRAALPHTHIALLTPAKLADLWMDQPQLNEVLAVSPDEGILQVARRVRRGAFDAALIFPNSIRSVLEMWLAGVPQRLGSARGGRRLLLTRALPRRLAEVAMRKRSPAEVRRLMDQMATLSPFLPPSAHHLHHYLHLAAGMGADPQALPPLLRVAEAAVADVRRRFGAPEQALLLGLNPGAEYGPAKRWPAERFAAACVELQRRTGCHWWIFGSAADRALAGELAARIAGAGAGPAAAVRSLAGETSLRELAAALKACRVLLTNDTGPMHVAAAVGTAVVAPFGSTSPELTGPGLPGQPSHRLLKTRVGCAPCFLRTCPIDLRCLKSIEVAEVVQAVLEVIGRQPPV